MESYILHLICRTTSRNVSGYDGHCLMMSQIFTVIVTQETFENLFCMWGTMWRTSTRERYKSVAFIFVRKQCKDLPTVSTVYLLTVLHDYCTHFYVIMSNHFEFELWNHYDQCIQVPSNGYFERLCHMWKPYTRDPGWECLRRLLWKLSLSREHIACSYVDSG